MATNEEVLQQYKDQVNQTLSELAPIWMPHEGQIPIIQDLLFNFAIGVFVQCGRKFGKTELAIFCCYVIAIMIPNAEVYYIADEKDHARDICWTNGRLPNFFTSFQKVEGETDEQYATRVRYGHKLARKYIARVDNQSMVVVLTNGSMIKVDGAKNFSRADGLSPAFVVYDEFKHHDARYDQAMRPNLKAKNGRILIIGTPPENEENYYCETAKEFQTRIRHKYYKRPCFLNPFVYQGKDDPRLKEDEEIYKRKGEHHIFLREFMAEIVPDEGRSIFPMFNKDFHVQPYDILLNEIKLNMRDWSYHVHYDPATTSTFAVLLVCINKYDRRIFLMDEIYEQRSAETTARRIYPRAVEKCKEIRKDMFYWRQGYDVAAAWFAAEVSNEFDVGITPCNKFMHNKEYNLSIIKESMLFNRFFMSDHCVHTRKEIMNYAKDEKGNIPKENDHNIDNLRYILNADNYDFVPRDFIPPPQKRESYSFADDFMEREKENDEENYQYYDPYDDITQEYYNG